MADLPSSIMKDFGWWQLRAVFLIYLCKIPSSWFMACMIYTGPAPKDGDFYCKPPVAISSHFNETKWIRAAHPVMEGVNDDHELSVDYCNVFEKSLEYYNDPNCTSGHKLSNDTKLIPCKAFEHRSDYPSIITQFDLVCSRYWLIPTTQCAHQFGVLLGGILTVQLMKTISPRNMMLMGMYTQIACGCITGYISAYEMHTLFRCLSAIFCGFMYTAGSVIMNDITGGKFKTTTICLFEQFWSIGVIMLPGIASLATSWNELYMAISLPTFVYIILHKWIPDSPRWLLKHGRVQEAKELLLGAAKSNGTEDSISIDFDHQLKSFSETASVQPEPEAWWTIWKEKGSTKNLICIHLAWGLFCTAYYGMLLNIAAFGREKIEFNTVVAGTSEIAGTFIGLLFIIFSKNKWLWCGLLNAVGCSVANLAWLIPPDVTGNDRTALLMITAMIPKACISCCLALLVTCTAELVGPSKKNGVAYSCTVWGRTCFLIAPYIVATVEFGQLVPLTAFGSMAVVGGIVVMCINRTQTYPIAQQQGSVYRDTMVKSTDWITEKQAELVEMRPKF
nr:solute carrier family 22 member 8-like [Aedes albopictus]